MDWSYVAIEENISWYSWKSLVRVSLKAWQNLLSLFRRFWRKHVHNLFFADLSHITTRCATRHVRFFEMQSDAKKSEICRSQWVENISKGAFLFQFNSAFTRKFNEILEIKPFRLGFCCDAVEWTVKLKCQNVHS